MLKILLKNKFNTIFSGIRRGSRKERIGKSIKYAKIGLELPKRIKDSKLDEPFKEIFSQYLLENKRSS